MAHHDESFTVDGELVVEITVTGLEVVNTAVKGVKSVSVLSDLLSVPGDLLIVVINSLIILRNLSSGVMNAVLKAGDRLTESLGTNEHVASLSNLELVSVLTEESAVGVESTDCLLEVGGSGVGR